MSQHKPPMNVSVSTLEAAKFRLNPGNGLGEDQGVAVRVFQEQYKSGLLAAVTDGADGTHEYFLDMDGYLYATIQAILNGGAGGTVTMTFEASLRDDGTDPSGFAAADWTDVTFALFGVVNFGTAGGPPGTLSRLLIFHPPLPVKWLKIKIVAATPGADDADWTLRYKLAA